ncbi:MAG: helix-turn-helix domain-containing protein [Proteobacteria bacterium]|jgi:excisionase family DNA binding protein|nr:helix-turn-helix domain-containing protein [Pseudomonadota bacterium]
MKFEEVEHPLMTIEEAASALRLSRNTINNWLSMGKLARAKVGRKTFLRRSDIEALLNKALKE